MGIYEKYCLPHLINCLCSLKPIMRQRQRVVPLAEGRVLEVGIGTALNLPFYNREKVDLIWGLEPSGRMRKIARKNLLKSPFDVQWLPFPAAQIPLDDASVDSVLLTYTLCSIPDWHAALSEMRRVLKPEGRLIFCEHGAAPDDSVRKWQSRITPLWKRIAGGCHLDRPVRQCLEDAGYRIEKMESGYVGGLPRIAGFDCWGTARKG